MKISMKIEKFILVLFHKRIGLYHKLKVYWLLYFRFELRSYFEVLVMMIVFYF